MFLVHGMLSPKCLLLCPVYVNILILFGIMPILIFFQKKQNTHKKNKQTTMATVHGEEHGCKHSSLTVFHPPDNVVAQKKGSMTMKESVGSWGGGERSPKIS